MNSYSATNIVRKIFTILGVALFCYVAVTYSKITILSSFIPFTPSPVLLHIFERHFWQFVFGFIAIGILSRGHLWSYGINSQNLKVSMKWLAWLYCAVILLTFFARISQLELLPVERSEFPHGVKDTIMVMLIYWMSSPVANQILFFGFGQTLLLKQFGDEKKIIGIPATIYISAILFALLGTDSSLQIGNYSSLTTLTVGIYSGVVYWKTNSLITPMLGHAFVFGFPLFVELVFLNFIR